jgi:hypothetical protein
MKSSSAFVSSQLRLIAAFLVLSTFASQTAFAASPQAPAQPAPDQTSAGQTIVPAATVVPLTLVSQIKSKSTKVGDTVRAQVAFPITVGTEMAIPAGTYVEGVVTSLTAQVKKTGQPDVQIHFTRLVYANGYTAALDAANTQASNVVPGSALPEQLSETLPPAAAGAGRTHIAFYGGEGFAPRAQTGTQPQEPTMPGPPMGAVIGATFGGLAALLIIGLVFGHHHKSNADYLLFDAGWQFQMTLTTPLVLDPVQVAAAANTPSH